MKRHQILYATTSLFALPLAYNNPGWKLDADGRIEMKDGNPLWLDSNGNEMTVEGNTISRLNSEAKTHRTEKEAAQALLKKFEGLDPDAARDAFDKLSKIDQKKLIDAGEVDKVREEISKSFTGQLTEAQQANEKLQAKVNEMITDNAFNTSEFIRDKIAVPADMFRSTFRNNFKVEDGKVIPYGNDGNKIYSKKRAGEVADFGEAVEILVDQYPHKESILKADQHSGTGNNGGGGNRNGGGRAIRRGDFENMSPMEKANVAALMQKGEARVID